MKKWLFLIASIWPFFALCQEITQGKYISWEKEKDVGSHTFLFGEEGHPQPSLFLNTPFILQHIQNSHTFK